MDDDEGSGAKQSAINSTIMDYYKKFGKKRDLEQYFSLSTAQGDVRDPTGTFWKQIKSHSDSSDSDAKRSDESQELCRISIQCSMPEPSSSQSENTKTKESASPPIIIEELSGDVLSRTHSRSMEEESEKSDDNQSQKSLDVLLDTSMNKPFSPTSSVTSQRKLEWDSLADVGYANESDRKTSASSLSTLERLALKQQYSNNDTNNDLGPPTAQSTPLDENGNGKSKKGKGKKTKFVKKNSDYVELNIPHTSSASQGINVNLTKHISFSVAKNGAINIEEYKSDIKMPTERKSVETDMTPQYRLDKEIQTSLLKTKETQSDNAVLHQSQRIPVLIRLNTLRRRNRRRKIKIARKKSKTKKRVNLENNETPVQDRSGVQLSEAESFEYMPGHVYNQNQMNIQQNKQRHSGNKSSLESSGITTDSSKISKLSFSKDLEKSIELLKATCKQHCEDKEVKKKLIKEIIKRILTIQYKDDESSTDFLPSLSLNKNKTGIKDANNTTTSTSDSNKSSNQSKVSRPKKSILRMDTFNANALASTSQSAPNLPAAITNDKLKSNLIKMTSSNTDSESSREKTSSDAFAKTSSEELYLKYLEALKREQAYKKHLRDKELFLKQKLASTESVKAPVKTNGKTNSRLKDLIRDLTRNNYDDGSGDASKLEGTPNSNPSFEMPIPSRSQRSHSVFTLSSGNSEAQTKKPNLKKKLQHDIKELSKEEHYCCCPHHSAHFKIDVADSSVQVNLKDIVFEKSKKQSPTCQNCKCRKESPSNLAKVISNNPSGYNKNTCLCDEPGISPDTGDNYVVYKCSRLVNKAVQSGDTLPKQPEVGTSKTCIAYNVNAPYELASSRENYTYDRNHDVIDDTSSDKVDLRRSSKSSQTNLMLKMLRQKSSEASIESPRLINQTKNVSIGSRKCSIREATRCIQTEISINPQISDPSLSDINIVNDNDCVKFISEQIKEVSRRSSKTDTSSKNEDTNGNTQKYTKNVSENSSEIIGTPKISTSTQNIDQPKLNNVDDIVVDSGKSSENFTIPIQGTNMTLMVSIGSKETPSVNIKIPEAHKSVVTERNNVIDQCTSLSEECSVGIQYDSRIDDKQRDSNEDIDHNSNTININNDLSYKPSYNANTYTEMGRTEFNTIPKRSPIGKRFLRANTDTGILGNSNIQTDKIIRKDKMTQQGITLDTPSNDKKIQSENTNFPERSSDESCGSNKTKHVEVQHVEDDLQNHNEGRKDSPKANIGPTCSTSYGNDKVTEVERDRNTNQVIPEISSREFESTSSCTKKSMRSEDEIPKSRKSSSTSGRQNGNDPILDMIKNITRRYSKDDMEKNKRKKCFKEIVTVLNYLLDTDDSTDREQAQACDSGTTEAKAQLYTSKPETVSESCQTKEVVDRGVQLSCKKSKKRICSTESSELPTSTDLPATSSDSATCKVLNRIKKECEKFHQKRCKSHSTVKKCEISSSTSGNDQCRRTHHSSCRLHKCKGHRAKAKPEKMEKKSVAYNLIIQTSESMVSEEVRDDAGRPLKNIIVRVPSTRNCNMPFKEMEAKIEKRIPDCSPRCNPKTQRSRSLPNESEISSFDDQIRRSQICSVREYLELNRPDFVEKSSQRQKCLKIIRESSNGNTCGVPPNLKMVVVHNPTCAGTVPNCNMYCGGVPITCNQMQFVNPCMNMNESEVTRIGELNRNLANERATHRDLLSMHVEQLPLNDTELKDLKRLARKFGVDPSVKKREPKLMNEKEMKKHSEKIYKSLPEVVEKKEKLKKESVKKTNLLMANIFRKNLQKKTLRGNVNISHYSTVIKI